MYKHLIVLLTGFCLMLTSTANAGLEEMFSAAKRGDWDMVFKEVKPLAEQGDSKMQCMLGHLYNEGKGVTQDYQKAVKWYLKAAEQGDTSAQFNLGVMSEKGHGLPQDFSEAAKWYRKSAEQGHSDAQFNLGIMYENGRGVPLDEAVKWYHKSAEQGHAGAQTNLGVMYRSGEGVRKNFELSYMWGSLAAAQGSLQAAKNLEFLTRNMTRAQVAKAQRMAREWSRHRVELEKWGMTYRPEERN
jgi:uncharacterized protein